MSASRPNILMIICHDLGQVLGCYGDESVPSPHLDSLAKEGVMFPHHFCAATPCSPARGCLMTGRYASSNGLMGLVNLGWSLPAQPTLATVLAELGYETHLIGLHHERKNVSDAGYQHFPKGPRAWAADQVSRDLEQFLASRRTGDPPFFVCAGTFEVHLPLSHPGYQKADPAGVRVPPYLRDKPEVRDELARFHGAIRFLDDAVGRILKALRDTEQESNTLVVFTTDHGEAFPGAKSTLFEPGIRTAMMMRWPEGFQGGRRPEPMISHVDLLPTLVELAGAVPSPEVQGRSFAPLLKEEAYQARNHVYVQKDYHDTYDPMRCVRGERYKYIRSYEDRLRISLPGDILRSQASLSLEPEDLSPKPREMLFDLRSDPGERKNLAKDSSLSTIRQELSDHLDRWMADNNDPLLLGSVPAPPGATVRRFFKNAQQALARIQTADRF